MFRTKVVDLNKVNIVYHIHICRVWFKHRKHQWML